MVFIKMASYTKQQHIEVGSLFYENDRKVNNVYKKLHDIYGQHEPSTNC